MQAAVLTRPGQFALEQRPVPVPGPGEALIRIARVGVCGTDLHIFKGHYAAESLPMIPGHEFTGTIAALGSTETRLSIGSKVVVDTNIGCGACFACRHNEILNCPEMRQMGIHIDGGFAEYMLVPARQAIEAPADMAFDVLALTEPLACVVRAARKARATFARSVVVLGAGPIGHLHVQLMRSIGAAPIIVADIVPERVALALRHGADIGTSDPAHLAATVHKATGGMGADLVIESVGAPALYRKAMSLVRKGGHVAAFGLTGPGEVLHSTFRPRSCRRTPSPESVAGSGQDMHDALRLLEHGRIDPAPFLGADFALTDIQRAFDSFADRPGDLKTQIVMA